MEKPKISILIPVYGTEKYIERCARSLFEQTFDSLEYIFVNDCTNDNSIAILERVIEEYPLRKNQIKILHHEVNKGLHVARKTGVLQAAGEYIVHIDSDDWVENDIYLRMYEKAKEDSADIVFCDYNRIYENGKIVTHRENNEYNCNKNYIIDNIIKGKIHGGLWRLLVARNLYSDHIIYAKGYLNEDLVLTTQLLYYSKKISWIDYAGYFYFWNEASVASSLWNYDLRLATYPQKKKNADILITFFTEHNDIKNVNVLKLGVLTHIDAINDAEARRMWKDSYPELKLWDVLMTKCSYKMKFRYICSLFNLTAKLHSLRKLLYKHIRL